MPDGKTHDKLTILGAVLAVPAWLFLAPPEFRTNYYPCVTLAAATLFSGLMLSPDLDLDSSIYHRWGPFRYLWLPYQKLVPHRSFVSHSLLIGPLLRLLYFLGILYILFRVVTWGLNFVIPVNRNAWSNAAFATMVDFPSRYPQHFYAALVGLLLGTALHVGADSISTRMKKANPFRKRRKRH